MYENQREPNPDVNTFAPADETDVEDVSAPETGHSPSDVEGKSDEDVIPVPPDLQPAAPVEEPPFRSDVPVGDVDDSPKEIAGSQ